jgi:formyl-CoA transferase
MLAAPLAGMMLADHGAQVIKIELPRIGDAMRSWGFSKGGHGLMWKMLNRNKVLGTLDLRRSSGKALFLRLLETSDVLIENFRPGTMENWGLDASTLRLARPDLIVLRISGFGQTGPRANQAGFGTLAEAMSGFAHVNGWPETPPLLPPFGLADAIAGITGAFGVLAALQYRVRCGHGQEVDIALYEPMLTVMGTQLIDYDQLQIVQGRVGNRSPFTAPRNAYKTLDQKWLAISASTQRTAERLFEVIGRPEMMLDPRFQDNRSRLANVDALDDAIADWIAELNLSDAAALLDAASVPASPIFSPPDILSDPHIAARGSVISIEDDDLGPTRIQGPVPRLSRSPGRIRHLGHTELGRDNSMIYGELLGLDTDEIQRLHYEGVI